MGSTPVGRTTAAFVLVTKGAVCCGKLIAKAPCPLFYPGPFMKLRNQLLALFCLLLFVALGVVYFRTWVDPRPFGVIVFLSDGLTTDQLAAARLYENGADHRLTVDGFPHLALVRNAARDFAVPDAAAAASAIATGQPGARQHLSVDGSGKALRTLAEIAKRESRSVGIVTNGQLTDPGVAAFYAHFAPPTEPAAIAEQLVQQDTVDVALGGGAATFQAKRPDGTDLVSQLRGKGAALFSTKAELEEAGSFHDNRIFGIFTPGDLPHADQIESGSQQPSLSDMVRRSIEFLQANRHGYLLIVDAALVTRAAERNEGERTLVETVAFDHAVAMATRYAGEKSLIVAVGKHGVGGLSLNGAPLRADHGVALLGTTPSGYPALTWATGPNGPSDKPSPRSRTEPAAFAQPAALSTVEDVIAVARGMGAEKLRGLIDGPELFDFIRSAL
jgi:alkaline phosphatase